METFVTLLITTLTGFVFAIGYIKYCYSYWKRRNVPYLEPKFPLGNHNTLLPKGISIGLVSDRFYHEFKKRGVKVGGVYMALQPQLVIADPALVKNVLVTDFQYFVDRGIYQTKKAPITISIFAQPGAEWKASRTKFTPTFTMAKLKTMSDTVVKSSEAMEQFLIKTIDQDNHADVDMLEVMACFTTDVIGSVIFGINCHSFTNRDAEFRRLGRQLFDEFHAIDVFKLFMTVYFPKQSNLIGISNIQNNVTETFTNSVLDAVKYRQENEIRRQDFLQTLIDLKNEGKLKIDEVVGQAFLFFAAGFETSSNAGTMCLYELAQQQHLQDKVRDDINTILDRYNGELSYNCIAEMKYLNQVFEETLRIWPPVSTLTRVCVKQYTFPGTDVKVEKGIMVLIPVLAMQRDPDYWPDPMRFDPDRFSGEIDKNLPYWPFGDGPRNCLGTKLGYMQVKVGLIRVLKNFRVKLSPKTSLPVELDPDTFVLHTKDRLYFRLEKL